ncbi:hypothetical protein [Nostoc sp.]|uniref:hypothetical protein n=1 Tax=Nostoc sp. TaxID=1180 RepID=UPI002FF5C46D
MSQIVEEVLAANLNYTDKFGDKGNLISPYPHLVGLQFSRAWMLDLTQLNLLD